MTDGITGGKKSRSAAIGAAQWHGPVALSRALSVVSAGRLIQRFAKGLCS
ncbi:hypothetical protein ABZY19_29280 [Streptomyces sp. NPDC006475]